MENRNGLVVNALLTQASGTAEREAALMMLAQRPHQKRVTVACDKAYDTKAFVAELRACQVTRTWLKTTRDEEARSITGLPATL